jgi:hypothetical protein
MSLRLPFRCGVPLNSTGGWCFASSICISVVNRCGGGNVEEEERCTQCAYGYEHDNTWGRFPNCSLPSLFLPIFFAISTFIFISCVLVFAKRFRLIHIKCIPLAKVYLLWLFAEWLENLALYLQNGRYEYASIFLAIRYCLGNEFAVELIFVLTRSLLPLMRGLEVKHLHQRWRIITAPPIVAVVCLSIVLATQPNAPTARFNV